MRKELERISPEAAGIKAGTVENFLKEVQHEKTEMHGVMAARDGKVFLEGYWSPFDKTVPHSCHSMGKSYTCTALGIAVTEGLVSMDDRIADIFAGEIRKWDIHQTEMFERLTVKHVTTMTNGMKTMSRLTDDWLRAYLENPVVYEPGTKFYYNTAGSCLLAVIVEKVTGKDVFTYLSEKLFCKIGIDPSTMIWLKFHDGYVAEPGLFSLTENNLRLGILYSNYGEWEGEQIIDRQWMRDAMSLQIDNSDNADPHEDGRVGYGYQLWMCTLPGAYRFDGGQGQYVIMLPEKKIVVAINQGGIEPTGPNRTLVTAYDHLIRKMEEKSFPEDEAADGALKAYIGTLTVPDDEPNSFMPAEDHFTGSYRVTSGNATPWIGVCPGGVNFFESFYDLSKKKEMTDFTLNVDKEKVTFVADGYALFTAWFDGVKRVILTDNVLPKVNRTATTAKFLDENTLVLTIHWIHSWFVTRMTFVKDGEIFRITSERTILNENRPWAASTAEAVKEA